MAGVIVASVAVVDCAGLAPVVERTGPRRRLKKPSANAEVGDAGRVLASLYASSHAVIDPSWAELSQQRAYGAVLVPSSWVSPLSSTSDHAFIMATADRPVEMVPSATLIRVASPLASLKSRFRFTAAVVHSACNRFFFRPT